ncbi:MAG: DUF6399 domain-containing protein [Ardenticatenales bacterium]
MASPLGRCSTGWNARTDWTRRRSSYVDRQSPPRRAQNGGHDGFWHVYVAQLLNTFAVEGAKREHIRDRLIPAFLILKVAPQAATAADRERLRATGHRLLLLARAGLADLSPDVTAAERLARECANLFVRASSCVEGRNGQLALQHRSLHRLSQGRLAALTVIHNDHIRRPDGSTPAQRFFGAPHDALFEWLVDHLDLPARPRSRTNARAA